MKNFIKTISFMVVTVLLLSSILPVSIYATSLTNGGETDSSVVGAKTGPEDVTIQVAEGAQLYKSVDERIEIPSNQLIDIFVVGMFEQKWRQTAHIG